MFAHLVNMFFAFFLSLILTRLIISLAPRLKLIDIPNERSSHEQVTPRGGGLSFVLIFLIYGSAVLYLPTQGQTFLPTLLIALMALAVLGLLDDLRTLSPYFKLVVQGILVTWLVYQLSPVSIWREYFGYGIGFVLTCSAVLWYINMYNFMDGIDGIAGTQAVLVSLCMAFWFEQFDALIPFYLCVIMAASVLGFLVFNWSPARVFMGDAGSLLLGGFFAALAVIGVNEYKIPVLSFLILMSVFLADTSLTCLRRLVHGENIFQAHRAHYYQQAAIAGTGHASVTLSVLLAGLAMSVLASIVVFSPQYGVSMFAICVAILLFLRYQVVKVFRKFKRESCVNE